MKLTEAKLKQMIFEALKSSKFQDFGIPTPDEKLRSELGDEMFDKIQVLDPEQSEVMRQTFDPDYPREINRESFVSFMESHGFEFDFQPGYSDFHEYDGYHVLRRGSFMRGMETLDLNLQTIDLKSGKGKQIQYDFYFKEHPMDSSFDPDLSGSIKVPDMFDLDIRKHSDTETVLSLIFNKEKEKIKELIGVSK